MQNTLKARGITIKSEGELTADQIDKGMTSINEVTFVRVMGLFQEPRHVKCIGT